ncbi:hypothetical protein L596_026082 [Steinernema carpocapsae]|uniref:Uncharacterized protein n=1 Tax=Steinernema carpocapsae TaxID=34508 RepID=A0A4V5ZY30_STECR|nr:hypothetical protein L596_026082 [Steinernema carpocapsae]
MIQMGIAQCFMSPGVITACLTCILGRDYFQMFAIAAPLWMVATRTAGVLGLALALHRLHVICNLSYPTVIHKILTFIAWSYAMGHYFFFVIPCCVFASFQQILTLKIQCATIKTKFLR